TRPLTARASCSHRLSAKLVRLRFTDTKRGRSPEHTDATVDNVVKLRRREQVVGMRKVKRTTGLWTTDGGFYYTRKWVDGKGKWVALGDDRKVAEEKLVQIKAGKRRVFKRMPVWQPIDEWLSS